jgi:hypothetical protein
MDPGIGVNLRVTALCSQGGRKYMEDTYNIWYETGEDLKWALIGIFDGHWGRKAAMFTRKYLMERIVKHEWFLYKCAGALREWQRHFIFGYCLTHEIVDLHKT